MKIRVMQCEEGRISRNSSSRRQQMASPRPLLNDDISNSLVEATFIDARSGRREDVPICTRYQGIVTTACGSVTHSSLRKTLEVVASSPLEWTISSWENTRVILLTSSGAMERGSHSANKDGELLIEDFGGAQ